MDERIHGLLHELEGELTTAVGEALGPRARSGIVKGSAHKGEDFVPRFSDFDLHVFCDPEIMRDRVVPNPVSALAIQREIGDLDPEAYGVGAIQLTLVDERGYPEGWAGPVSDTYRVSFGDPPDWLGRVDPGELEANVRGNLDRIPERTASLLESIADKPDERLERYVRLAWTFLKPSLRSACALGTGAHEDAWRLPVTEILDRVEEAGCETGPAWSFRDALANWDIVRARPDALRELFWWAVEELDLVGAWYGSQPR